MLQALWTADLAGQATTARPRNMQTRTATRTFVRPPKASRANPML